MPSKTMKWVWDLNIHWRLKFVLLSLVHEAGKNNTCCISIEQLGEKCGLSKRSVIRSLNELIEYKLISKQARYSEKGGRTSNVYKLNKQ